MAPIQKPSPPTPTPQNIVISSKSTVHGYGKHLRDWVKKKAKHKVTIDYASLDKYNLNCDLCERWKNEIIKSHPTAGDFQTIFACSAAQTIDFNFFHAKIINIKRHFNANIDRNCKYHQIAFKMEYEYHRDESSAMLFLMDMAYGCIINTSPKKEYLEKVVIVHNQSLRSKCTNPQCCPIGTNIITFIFRHLYSDIYIQDNDIMHIQTCVHGPSYFCIGLKIVF